MFYFLWSIGGVLGKKNERDREGVTKTVTVSVFPLCADGIVKAKEQKNGKEQRE